MRKRWILGVVGALALFLAGCGGGDSVPPPPPLSTAPLLTVTFTVPNTPGTNTVQIFSDLTSDGDIAFDPVRLTYTVTQGPSTVLFGIDSSTPNVPEYRAFLTFPLDGITGQPVVPGDAVIVSADVEVFVDFLDFAPFVSTFLDLVLYPPNYGGGSGLGSIDPVADFNQLPLATRSPFDFLTSDIGNFVRIEVTSLMQAAQVFPPLPDFQLRFSSDIARPGLVGLNDLGTGLAGPAQSAPSRSAARKVVETPRAREGVAPSRRGAAAPFPSSVPSARRR
jgi:hypothetical protein